MLYKKEFDTEYHPSRSIVDIVEDLGFTDSSWHNNTCPSWVLSDRNCLWVKYELFIDAEDEKLREVGPCRYTLLKYNEEEDQNDIDPIIETEFLGDVVNYVKSLVCVRVNCKREPLPSRKYCDTCAHITQQNYVRPVRTFD